MYCVNKTFSLININVQNYITTILTLIEYTSTFNKIYKLMYLQILSISTKVFCYIYLVNMFFENFYLFNTYYIQFVFVF